MRFVGVSEININPSKGKAYFLKGVRFFEASVENVKLMAEGWFRIDTHNDSITLKGSFVVDLISPPHHFKEGKIQ